MHEPRIWLPLATAPACAACAAALVPARRRGPVARARASRIALGLPTSTDRGPDFQRWLDEVAIDRERIDRAA